MIHFFRIFSLKLEDAYDFTFSSLPPSPQSEPETIRISDALVLNFPKNQVFILEMFNVYLFEHFAVMLYRTEEILPVLSF